MSSPRGAVFAMGSYFTVIQHSPVMSAAVGRGENPVKCIAQMKWDIAA